MQKANPIQLLFISRRGSMYRYFDYLAKHLDVTCDVIDYNICPLSLFKKIDIERDIIEQEIDFQFIRKTAKYTFSDFAKRYLRFYYRIEFYILINRLYTFLTRHEVKHICVWNGNRLHERAVQLVAKQLNIPVFFMENGLLPNTTTLDPCGVNDANSLPRNIEFYRNFIAQSDLEINRTLVQRDFHKKKKTFASHDQFFSELPEKYVFCPFQVRFDSQVLVNSDHVKSMDVLFDWLEAALDALPSDSVFVVKEHPTDPYKYDHLYARNPRIVFSNIDTQQLIDNAEAVITINSSVGLESLLRHQKVIVLGNACYRIDGLTKYAPSIDALKTIIASLDDWQVQKEDVDTFLRYLSQEYCVAGTWRHPDHVHLASIQNKFHQLMASPS